MNGVFGPSSGFVFLVYSLENPTMPGQMQYSKATAGCEESWNHMTAPRRSDKMGGIGRWDPLNEVDKCDIPTKGAHCPTEWIGRQLDCV